MTDKVKTAAPKILEIIKGSNNILLHCHPSPDPDSVGSALAMKFALEQLGKKATVIRGDSEIPQAFMHFPGAREIIPKNFFEINLADFDLFIVQDSSVDRVSKIAPVVIPDSLKFVLIDHHISNVASARDIDIVDPSYPATALILSDLFKLWNVTLTPEIAGNLFIGSYTDTGGFKFASVTADTFASVTDLARACPNFSEIIFKMENALRPEALTFQGIAYSNIDKVIDGTVAISSVSYEDIQKNKLTTDDMSSGYIANVLKSVIGWDVGVCLIEEEKGEIHVSFRTRDSQKYDLSVIAVMVGGGGHKAAAGAVIAGSLDEAKKKVIAAIESYVKIGGQK